MERAVGTVVRGVRAPIIREGDVLEEVVAKAVLDCAAAEGVSFRDRDVVAVTEAIVARAQGNYATPDDIAEDVRRKTGGETAAVVFPITSRNRFAICLRGIARGLKKMVLLLSYPADEVGNHLIDLDLLDEAGVNPWSDVLTEARYRELFGETVHHFTGVDYVAYYRELVESEGCELTILFANDPREALKHTDVVLACDIHTRARTKRLLKKAGARVVLGLDELLTEPVNGSGYNEQYGLLGSNKATEERIKLFPRDGQRFVEAVAARLREATGKLVEVMIYGDGAFKDSVGKVWELADPVVSPAYTAGLEGTPNELKLKYLADNDFAALEGDALKAAIVDSIKKKDGDLKGSMASQGTTPRRITDLLGSLSDLTSGSGDKGTPIVWIQGYFDNYAKD
ncbi:MAG: coenzyme F420-0:L-glutamate ligase [Clostridia bacterium]|nr:coenzyme F420-0:L-glutamate ligase [Clostridia bacterium]